MNALEVDPASDYCQRWNERSHSWRHKSEGGFDPDDYTVEPIDELVAKEYVTRHHYSGSYPAASQRYGMMRDGQLVGVMVLGIPVREEVLTNVFADLQPFSESLELARLVLDDSCPGNSETWFIGQSFNEAAATGVRGIVSFADPCPRRIGDRLIFPGHVGTIYQAKGALFCGRGRARWITVLPNGQTLNDRSMEKVKKQQRGHRHVEERLMAMGARVLRAGENPTGWLTDALDTIGATRIRHQGNFRYAFALGTTRRQRQSVRIALPGGPYPKHTD